MSGDVELLQAGIRAGNALADDLSKGLEGADTAARWRILRAIELIRESQGRAATELRRTAREAKRKSIPRNPPDP